MKMNKKLWALDMFSQVKLQYTLFLTFTIIASLPVFILGYWVQLVALEHEVTSVEEKHLLLAKNVTRDLSRYVLDVESFFKFITLNLSIESKVSGTAETLKTLGIRYIYIADNNGKIKTKFPKSLLTDDSKIKIEDELWGVLQKTIAASRNLKNIAYSNLIRTGEDEIVFFLVNYIQNNEIAIAALSTSYIQEAQKQISFGRRGHVAIVDRAGRAIAHPVAAWVKSMKDMSFLPPVKKMMNGETGVSKFYTPAMQGDVIAGYTVVPRTGWGVMVPQPFEELEEHANKNQKTAFTIIIIGLTVAGLISWFLSRLLVGPILSVVYATKFSEDEKLKFILPVEVSNSFNFIPKEIRELIDSFNSMGSRLNSTTTELYSKIDFANKEVQRKNLKLTEQSSELKLINIELERLSSTDNLTTLFNRRMFDIILDSEFSFSVRYKEYLSLVMLDVDNFKGINDKYGHACGDKVLIDIANILKENIRASDVAFRIGGEEFTIICRKTNCEESKIMMEHLRKSLEKHELQFGTHILTVTCSFGIMTIPNDAIDVDNAGSLYRYSDKAMYYSKHHGRNRVTHYSDIIAES
jgi:diguanylate cyclase (GGDEF)-like protein